LLFAVSSLIASEHSPASHAADALKGGYREHLKLIHLIPDTVDFLVGFTQVSQYLHLSRLKEFGCRPKLLVGLQYGCILERVHHPSFCLLA
jgi:hypothetical protein